MNATSGSIKLEVAILWYLDSESDINLLVEDTKLDHHGIKLSAYPNPFKDKISITFTDIDFSEPAMLEIYNSFGVLIQKLSPIESRNGTYIFEWDGVINNGEYVQPGTYVVVCTSKSQKLACKIFYLGK